MKTTLQKHETCLSVVIHHNEQHVSFILVSCCDVVLQLEKRDCIENSSLLMHPGVCRNAFITIKNLLYALGRIRIYLCVGSVST